MKKILIFSLLLFGLNVFAQTTKDPKAKEVLDKTTQKLQKTNGASAEFAIIMEDAQTDKKQTYNGSLLLKGNKFKLTIPNIETYFNGKTQWVYLKEAQEVTISTPTAEELSEINPTSLLNSYKKGYKMRYEGEKIENGKTIHEVDIFPEDLEKEFFRINIKVEKDSYQLVSIRTFSKGGTTISILMKKYQPDMKLDDSVFSFDATSNPDIEVIDLR